MVWGRRSLGPGSGSRRWGWRGTEGRPQGWRPVTGGWAGSREVSGRASAELLGLRCERPGGSPLRAVSGAQAACPPGREMTSLQPCNSSFHEAGVTHSPDLLGRKQVSCQRSEPDSALVWRPSPAGVTVTCPWQPHAPHPTHWFRPGHPACSAPPAQGNAF